MMNKLPYLLPLLIIAFSSCKKEVATVSVKEKLIGHTWKSSSLKNNGVDESSWCWLNSKYDFTPGGTLYITQSDNLGSCSGTPGAISRVGYKLIEKEKYLVLLAAAPTSADTFEIISISDEAFKTKRVVNKNTSTPNTWEDTFLAE
jgi:hypothetical protein